MARPYAAEVTNHAHVRRDPVYVSLAHRPVVPPPAPSPTGTRRALYRPPHERATPSGSGFAASRPKASRSGSDEAADARAVEMQRRKAMERSWRESGAEERGLVWDTATEEMRRSWRDEYQRERSLRYGRVLPFATDPEASAANWQQLNSSPRPMVKSYVHLCKGVDYSRITYQELCMEEEAATTNVHEEEGDWEAPNETGEDLMLALPHEILCYIFSLLPVDVESKEIRSVRAVCRRWWQATNSELLWRMIHGRCMGGVKPEHETWRRWYEHSIGIYGPYMPLLCGGTHEDGDETSADASEHSRPYPSRSHGSHRARSRIPLYVMNHAAKHGDVHIVANAPPSVSLQVLVPTVTRHNHLSLLEVLLSRKGVDPNHRYRVDTFASGACAMHVAASYGWCEAIHLLVDHGALVDEPNDEGDTPLVLAYKSGHLDAIRVLQGYGARDSANCLVAAASQCNAEIVAHLCQRKLNPNAPDSRGRIALIEACRAPGDSSDIVRLLLEQGARPFCTWNSKWAGPLTPLLASIHTGDVTSIGLLLRAGYFEGLKHEDLLESVCAAIREVLAKGNPLVVDLMEDITQAATDAAAPIRRPAIIAAVQSELEGKGSL